MLKRHYFQRKHSGRKRLFERAALNSSSKFLQIAIIKEKLGDCQHHGTGNPLIVRSPDTPKDYAVQTLANILLEGVLGQPPQQSSVKLLRTERGKLGSFWTSRLRLAGSYGWTGIVLPKDADSSKPFPVLEDDLWFLVETKHEKETLESLLLASSNDCWNIVKDRVVTIEEL